MKGFIVFTIKIHNHILYVQWAPANIPTIQGLLEKEKR